MVFDKLIGQSIKIIRHPEGAAKLRFAQRLKDLLFSKVKANNENLIQVNDGNPGMALSTHGR
jgi:hypothetical protein